MLENIQQAFQSVWNHKMRSFLTMLGIIIGIASIITIVSSIKGTSEQIKQNLIGSGTNAVVVSLYQNEYPYDSNEMGAPDGVAVITPEVRDELLKLDKVSDVSLFYQRDYNTGVFYLSTGYNGKMLGVDEHYMDLYGYQLCYGRSFVEEDFTQNRKVVLLNTQAVSTLFAGKNPVGKTVEVRGEPFTIIGVVEQGGGFKPVIENLQDYEMYADTSSGSMFITNKGWEIAYRFDQPQSVAVKATGTDDMTAAGKAVADALTSSQIKTHDGELSYQAQDLLQQAEQLQAMSTSTNRQLIWIASISLLVGGIGVMNIMLVSVAERTSEIGLKKAIGARKRRILRQFLTEAAVLTSLGGILGILAGIGLAELLGRAMQTPTAISVPAILVAALFSTVIGIVFGLLPATKAANMNPIDALRRE
jgi:putative ABC transport system permease protein